MYPFHKNWAPRIGLAYAPTGDSGISKLLFGGPGKTSIRAGVGMYYDLVGQPLAQSFSSTTPGLSQSFSNPANLLTSAQVPRYTTFYTVPSRHRAAAAGGRIAVGLSLWRRPVGGVRHHQQHRPAVGRALHYQSRFHPRPRSRPVGSSYRPPTSGVSRAIRWTSAIWRCRPIWWTPHPAKPTSRQCRP